MSSAAVPIYQASAIKQLALKYYERDTGPFSRIKCMCSDPSGIVYVFTNNRVYSIDLGCSVRHIAGNGADYDNPNGTTAKDISLSGRVFMCADKHGYLYIVHSRDSVIYRVRTSDSSFDIYIDNGNNRANKTPIMKTRMIRPAGIAYSHDDDRLWIVDSEGETVCMAELKSNSDVAILIGRSVNSHESLLGPYETNSEAVPSGLVVFGRLSSDTELYYSNGYLYINESRYAHLHKLNVKQITDKSKLIPVAGYGIHASTPSHGPGISTKILGVESLSIDDNNVVYGIENGGYNRLIKIDSDGYLHEMFGDGDDGFADDIGTIVEPTALCAVGHSSLYVSTYSEATSQCRILRIETPNSETNKRYSLSKFGWDFDSGIYAFEPLLKNMSPFVYNILQSFASSTSGMETILPKQCMQELIDYLMYGQKVPYCPTSNPILLLIYLSNNREPIFRHLKETLAYRLVDEIYQADRETTGKLYRFFISLSNRLNTALVNTHVASWVHNLFKHKMNLLGEQKNGGSIGYSDNDIKHSEEELNKKTITQVLETYERNEEGDRIITMTARLQSPNETHFASLLNNSEKEKYRKCVLYGIDPLRSLFNGNGADLIINIQGHHFKCHRTIICSTSAHMGSIVTLMKQYAMKAQDMEGGLMNEVLYIKSRGDEKKRSDEMVDEDSVIPGEANKLVIGYLYDCIEPLLMGSEDMEAFIMACDFYSVHKFERSCTRRLVINNKNFGRITYLFSEMNFRASTLDQEITDTYQKPRKLFLMTDRIVDYIINDARGMTNNIKKVNLLPLIVKKKLLEKLAIEAGIQM